MIIGLTGQTGSGKSTLCGYLEEKGFFICDCDKVAREVRNDKEFSQRLAEVFGLDLLCENGEIDKKRLAERAFESKENTEKLNEIMHPEILARSFEKMENALKDGFEFAVLDAPLLFESGADKKCDFVVAVTADREARLERILSRDKISKAVAENRMNVQYDDSFYTERADYVIFNDSIDTLSEKADSLALVLRDYKSDTGKRLSKADINTKLIIGSDLK